MTIEKNFFIAEILNKIKFTIRNDDSVLTDTTSLNNSGAGSVKLK